MSPARLARAIAVGAPLAAALALTLATLAPSPAVADQTASDVVTCKETIPKGAKRPKIKEKFPGEVTAGFEAPLEIEIRHGKGETPLPSGFKLLPGSPTKKFVEEAGFILAEPNGATGVTVETKEEGSVAVTRVKIPLVVAPKKSGKQALTLPQMPLSIDRANGDKMVVCTQLHLLTALDPTAGEEDPKPRPNPAGRPQREEWAVMKIIAWVLLGLLLLAAIIAWWVRRQLRKPVPAPEPERRPPWEVALGELAQLGGSPLLDESASGGPKRAEHFDKVSDTLRKYLGARYGFEDLGFDGLETTTDEMMGLLKRVRPHVPSLDLVQTFLSECDLVKFANVEPAMGDCRLALDRAEKIVRATVPPVPAPGAMPPGVGSPVAGAPGVGPGAPLPIAPLPSAPLPMAGPSAPQPLAVPAAPVVIAARAPVVQRTEIGPAPIAAPSPIPTVIHRTVPGGPLVHGAPEPPTTAASEAPAPALAEPAAPARPLDADTLIDPPREPSGALDAQTLIDPPTPLDEPPVFEPAPEPLAAVPAPVPAPPVSIPAPTPTPSAAAFVIPGRHAPDKPAEDPDK